jgi:ABC-type sugar transport system substrate-binding protein
MNKRTRDTLVALLAVGGAAVSLYFGLAGRSPKVDLNPYEVLGAVTAEETAKLLGNQGMVLVMVRGTGAEENPSVEAELKAFRQTLKQHAGLSLVTERVQASPMQMMATGGGVPPDRLFQALEAHADARAVVLFGGMPPLADSQSETLKERGIKTVVVSSFRPGYRRLLEQQVIHLAIVPRPEAPPPDAPRARTLRERFDQDYLIITPADTARLP